jgi:fibronectin type 3 domain-containing protein
VRYLAKVLSPLFLAALISGCANKESLLDRPKIDPNLPKPMNVRTISDRTSIGFEWEYVNNPVVEGYKVYKSVEGGGSELTTTIKDRFTSHYADKGLKADTAYSYRLSSYTKDGVESDATTVVSVKTKPVLESVSFIAAVDNLPNRAKIVWRPHISPDVVEYTVQKSGPNDKNWDDVAKVSPRLMAEYIDTNVESGKTYYYRVIAKTFDGSYSKPSEIVTVNTKKLPLPATKLYATKDLPKQIAVSWEAPEQKEFDKYNLYRADAPDSKYSLVYTGIETKFLDKIDEDGAVRYYKVAVVDKDALESPFELSATGVTRPKPITPVFTLATIKENRVYLTWTTNEKEPVTFKITKKWGSFLNKQNITFTDIKGFNFEDKDVDLGQKYQYYIEAVDRDGIISKPSDEVELFVPKGL